MFWVGSEAPIHMRPTHWKPYDGEMPNSDRIDSVLSWMTLGDDKEIELGTLYFSFVDGVGHDFGPDAEEIISAIQQADSLIGYLTQQIEALGLEDQVNLIIVADHGMAQNSRDKIIYVDDYINVDDLDIYSWGTSFSIRGDKQTLDSVYQQLKPNEDQFQYIKRKIFPIVFE